MSYEDFPYRRYPSYGYPYPVYPAHKLSYEVDAQVAPDIRVEAEWVSISAERYAADDTASRPF
jgi:hypothetical protein